MLLCLPTRPRKGGDGNGGFFYFKKVSPLGTPYLVLFPFYLLLLFTKQCRSIFIEMMKLCQSSYQRNLESTYTCLPFDF